MEKEEACRLACSVIRSGCGTPVVQATRGGSPALLFYQSPARPLVVSTMMSFWGNTIHLYVVVVVRGSMYRRKKDSKKRAVSIL